MDGTLDPNIRHHATTGSDGRGDEIERVRV